MSINLDELKALSAKYIIDANAYGTAFSAIPNMTISNAGDGGNNTTSCSNHLDQTFIDQLKQGIHLEDSFFSTV